MANSEKKWQLLMVADDGRIVPLRRVKAIAVAVVILLLTLGLVCAGLGWRLKQETGSHRQTLDQLAAARQEAAHYKSEHEIITAELVLAEARMEKAGLPVPERRARTTGKSPQPVKEAPTAVDERREKPQPGSNTPPTPAKEPSTPTRQEPPPVQEKTDRQASPKPSPQAADQPAVTLSNVKIHHDSKNKVLQAQFRVNNAGSGSSRVTGRCVVVLKGNSTEPKTWMSLPEEALVSGKPNPKRGKVFRISRFINMEIVTPVRTDPSVYKTATVYVFDNTGDVLLEKVFPIDLPAPASAPAPEPSPAEAESPVKSDTQADDAPSEKDPAKAEDSRTKTVTDSRARF